MMQCSQAATRRAAATMLLNARRAKHYKVLTVGGGAGGLAVSSTLSNKLGKGAVGIIEPSSVHYYQPSWTMVGGGVHQFKDSMRDQASVMPRNADWIQDYAVAFKPEENKVVTQNGDEFTYDFLVVAAGFQLDWDKIKGLKDALGKDGVTSNYSPKSCEKSWEFMQAFKGGNAIFTQPDCPIKCAGAPQKIMYLFEDYITRQGLRDKTNVTFMQGLPAIFGIKKYADVLTNICKDRDIDVQVNSVLKEIKPETKEAVFQQGDKTTTVNYDYIHVTPYMSAPDFIKKSSLANAAGFVDVDQYTMQHVKYPNIFSLGDCSSVPTSKTAAAVASESGVVKQNLLAALEGKPLPAKYDGYASCPLVTGRGKLVLAEFSGFTGQPLETFFFDQGKERWSMYSMKKDLIPRMYWDQLITGLWNGPTNVRFLTNPLGWQQFSA
ncbi:flavo-binding protein [Salpingoeca rosetta]|uniref:Sulfide:quinone oxidoreductase, mitochondrial n=1 Tax=Salpingoeca rosetta (strain ATCC 50818 / BSB-021) TaxID=946362 RepID=F2ULC9_SALR5|nr:sulfide quinone reductase [Salpingoeca rosetta]XP_004990029.1 flavo-binding protein [Salpingoeca rosetta]XP_012493094.1 sulfide quinone reductase, variant [Salpingoeca rosetta]XP_012493095.1 flavo-binding protein, variant [Salpingoeca rosetta]EGD77928.1 sulfide quinone reductase, variant [Salpingoeca rosetta]EGD77929.1 sulfide quinone reductase [Salpingoeca rosetta]EGD77966.1 flavo-binding protein, variant [Salpingoeca rosetta]EGD77967.1 flavo-binding protein [Salpingoeca rosetta]|eukprot:XP_004989992.1 sulfide quinone reductase [Salpingoeca rosetta]